MKKVGHTQAESMLKSKKLHRYLRRAVALLSVVVMLFTINTLKKRANTLERIPMCGMEEHLHDESCFNELGELICLLPEHQHTDACFQQAPVHEESAEEFAEEMEVDLSTEDESEVESQEALPVEELPVEEEPGFELSQPALLSDILQAMNLPVALNDVIDVGQVVNTEADAGLVSVERQENGDALVSANAAFDAAELAIITETDILTVKLVAGAAAAEPVAEEPVAEPVVEEPAEEIPAETVEETVEATAEDGIVEEIAPVAEEPTEVAEIETENIEEQTEVENIETVTEAVEVQLGGEEDAIEPAEAQADIEAEPEAVETAETEPEVVETVEAVETEPEVEETVETAETEPEVVETVEAAETEPEVVETVETAETEPEVEETVETAETEPEVEETVETAETEPEVEETVETAETEPEETVEAEPEENHVETVETEPETEAQSETVEPTEAESEPEATETEPEEETEAEPEEETKAETEEETEAEAEEETEEETKEEAEAKTEEGTEEETKAETEEETEEETKEEAEEETEEEAEAETEEETAAEPETVEQSANASISVDLSSVDLMQAATVEGDTVTLAVSDLLNAEDDAVNLEGDLHVEAEEFATAATVTNSDVEVQDGVITLTAEALESGTVSLELQTETTEDDVTTVTTQTVDITLTGYTGRTNDAIASDEGVEIVPLGDNTLPNDAYATIAEADEVPEHIEIAPVTETTAEAAKAFDIAVVNDNQDKIAQTGEVEVTVTPENLNVYSEVPEGATADSESLKLELYHVHDDGTVELVPDASFETDEEGNVTSFTFTTESFSTYVVKYTVDFTYVDEEGTEHFWQFPGSGSYSLREVLSQLGIEGETITDASLELTEAVGETSEDALYLTQDEETGEYSINSDVAFDDTYTLTVTLDNTQYVVTVTDEAQPASYNVSIQLYNNQGGAGSMPSSDYGSYYLAATVTKPTANGGQKTYCFVQPLNSDSVSIESFFDPADTGSAEKRYHYQQGDYVKVQIVSTNSDAIFDSNGVLQNTSVVIDNGTILKDYSFVVQSSAEEGSTSIIGTQAPVYTYTVNVKTANGADASRLDLNNQDWYVYAQVTREDGVYVYAQKLTAEMIRTETTIDCFFKKADAYNGNPQTTNATSLDETVAFSLLRPAGPVSDPAWKYFAETEDHINVNGLNGSSIANKYTLEVNGRDLVLREAPVSKITVSTNDTSLDLPSTEDGAYFVIGELGFRDGLEDKKAYSVHKLTNTEAYDASFDTVYVKGQYSSTFNYQDGAAAEHLTGTRYYEPYIVFIPDDMADEGDADRLTSKQVVEQFSKTRWDNPTFYVPYRHNAVLGKYRVETTGGTLESPDTTVSLNLLPGIQVTAQVKDADGNEANFNDTNNYYILAEMNQGGVKSYAYTKLNLASNSSEGTGAARLQNFVSDGGSPYYCTAEDEATFYVVESGSALNDLASVKGALRYGEGQLMSKYVPSFNRNGDDVTVTLQEAKAYAAKAQTVRIEMWNKAQTTTMVPNPQLSAHKYYVVAWLSAKDDAGNQPVAWRVLPVDKSDLNADGVWETTIQMTDTFNICDSQLAATSRTLAGCDPDQYNLNLRMFSSSSDQSTWAGLIAGGTDAAPDGYDFKGVFTAEKADPNQPDEVIAEDTSIIRLHQAYANKEYGIRVYVDQAGLEIPEGEYVVRVKLIHETGDDTYAFAKLQVSANTDLTNPCVLDFYSDNMNRIWRDKNNGNIQNAQGNYIFTGNEKGVVIELLQLINTQEAFGEWVKVPSQTTNYTLVKPGESINLYTPSIGERESVEIVDAENPDNSKLCIYDVIRFTKDVNGVTIGELQSALATATNFGLYTELLSKHATDMESNIGAAVITCTMGGDYGFTTNNTLVNELKVVKRWYGSNGLPAQNKDVQLRLYPVETYDENTGEYTLASTYYRPVVRNGNQTQTVDIVKTDDKGTAQIVFNRLPAGKYVLKEVINGKEYAFNSAKTDDGVIKADDNTSISFTDEIITVKNINVNVNYFGDVRTPDLWHLIRHSRGGIIVTDSDEDYNALVARNNTMQGNEAGIIYKTGTAEYPTTYNIPSDMENLRALSRRLVTDGSSETVKVINVTAEELNRGNFLEIKGDGRFVVVNVDMSNMGNVATVKVPTRFDGVTLEADFGQKGSEYANKVLFNFVSNGQPYTGKINTEGMGAGVLLAPSAIVADLGGNWGGTIICHEAQHTGSEIHSDSANKVQHLNTVVTNSEVDKNIGNLELQKQTVGENLLDNTTWFTFVVTLKDDHGQIVTDNYVASGLRSGAEVHFVDGVARVQVRANNKVTITGIPAGYTYEVTEVQTPETAHYRLVKIENGEGQITDNGTIQKNKTVVARVINTLKDTEGCEYAPKVTKVIQNKSGEELTTPQWPVKAQTVGFTFALASTDAAPCAGMTLPTETTVTATATYKSKTFEGIAFEYVREDGFYPHTYQFSITEQVPAEQDRIPGVTYCETPIPLTVVIDVRSGSNTDSLYVKSVQYGTAAAVTDQAQIAEAFATVVNTYDSVKVQPKAYKKLDGQAYTGSLTDGSGKTINFTFQLTPVSADAVDFEGPSDVVDTATTKGGSEAVFQEKEFTKPGTYVYKITEWDESDIHTKIAYDKAELFWKLVVGEKDGKLTITTNNYYTEEGTTNHATSLSGNQDGTQAVFENHELTNFYFIKIWKDGVNPTAIAWPNNTSITVTLKRMHTIKDESGNPRLDDSFSKVCTATSGENGTVTLDSASTTAGWKKTSEENNNYRFDISGLEKYAAKDDPWIYYAEETNVPSGFYFRYGTEGNGLYAYDKNENIIYNNRITVHLPATGGVGTNALYALGGGLVLLAVLGWVLGSRKRRDDEA